MEGLKLLQALLDHVPAQLEKITSAKAEIGSAPSQWSPKQELGHLLDSAANNHQRIVRAQLEDKPAMPGYDGERWVELHAYQQRHWTELINLWRALNGQLLAAARAVPDSAWSCTCTIAGSKPLTLKFVFEDSIEHMMHHLQHMGIQMNDLQAGKERVTND
jgi:DinB superfamily